MGQRARILTEIAGYRGFVIASAYFEDDNGARVAPVRGYAPPSSVRLVLCFERRWAPRCSHCGALCKAVAHERLAPRRWADLPWAGRPVELELAPIRIKCKRCGATPVEMLPWADPKQRHTRRFQQRLAFEAASMPVSHVALAHGLSWGSVRRAEGAALARWQARRVEPPLRQVGVDEKFLGRRHHLEHRFVTVVSNLETGEPLWIGAHRREATLDAWLMTLSPEAKAQIGVFAMDMHQPFANAIRADPSLAHAAIVHDPFHIMKRAGEAMDEVRREVFFRAGAEMRRIGRGTRWLVLRAWSKATDDQRAELRRLFSYNAKLARAYQIVEELRDVLRAPDGNALAQGLAHVLLRTERRANVPLRKLHDSLVAHWKAIVALGEHRPPTGRIEALNNNWEALVRRGRGYRDHGYLLLKLRFMTANPLRDPDDARRFLALDLPQPMPRVA